MSKKAYTLYLAKESITEFDDLLTENATERLEHPNSQVLDPEGFADRARLVVFSGNPIVPKWMTDLQSLFDVREHRSSSACSLLMFETERRVFVATFGHGWMYLKDSALEADFGLKVSLNALDESRLRRLERANLGDALRGVSLSPFHRDFRSFGLDDALDLIRKVSGSTREEASADVMAGAQSLKLSGEISLADLPGLAQESLQFLRSNEYQRTAFQIIDFVRPIADPTLIEELDDLAATSIRMRESNFELGLPETSEDEGVGYKFIGPRLRRHYPDLTLRNYVSALGDRLDNVDRQTLRSHGVAAVYEDGVRPQRRWTIRSALVGSIVHETKRYAINEGSWYGIDDQFRHSIEESFAELVADWENDQPRPLRRIYDDAGNGVFETEAEYNIELCHGHGYVLMDRQLIRVPDTQAGGFEACDALDIGGKRFIHVKRSSRRSSVLSHFFKQGSNSGQQFKRFQAAWNNLAEKVEAIADRQTRDALLEAIGNEERKWRVEYWIIDVPRQDGEFNIPFFSKISLRDEVRNLRAMDYEVCIRFIRMEPEPI